MPKLNIGWFTGLIVTFLAVLAVSDNQRSSGNQYGTSEEHHTCATTISQKEQKHERLLSANNGLILFHLRKEVSKSLNSFYPGPLNPYLNTEIRTGNLYFAAIQSRACKKVLGMLFPFHCHW